MSDDPDLATRFRSKAFGSFGWGLRTSGKLTLGNRLVEMLHGIKRRAQSRSGKLGGRLGLRPHAIEMLLDEIPIPRSSLVEAAEASLAGTPAWILPHSMRTYVWAVLLGRHYGYGVDAEHLLVAALLHDIGLVHGDGAECFAVRSAQRAWSLVVETGQVPPGLGDFAFAERVADAIVGHLNVRPASLRPDTLLLQAGAAFDVVGERFEQIAPSTRAAVLRAWPRGDFANEIRQTMKAEAAARPETRIGFLCHSLGFLQMIRDADRRFAAPDASAREPIR